ncbi:hypothetical protein JCM10207_008297 [Rhodosporidiobolus poonsookiae]
MASSTPDPAPSSPDAEMGVQTRDEDKTPPPRDKELNRRLSPLLGALDNDDELDELLDASADEDVKPIVSRSPSPAQTDDKKDKGKEKDAPAIIDLCDESDGETPPPPGPKAKQRPSPTQLALSNIRAAVPDVDPKYLVATYKRMSGDADATVNRLFGENYPLRGGGWKWNVEGEGSGSEGSEEEVFEVVGVKKKGKGGEAKEKDKGKAKKKAAPAKGKAKKEKKKVIKSKGKGKKRKAPEWSSDEEDDSEVDQLASDTEDQGNNSDDEAEEEERTPLTKKEALEQAPFWLDVEERKTGSDDYQKAALDQLYRDFAHVAELQIRSEFESDKNLYFYAPTWFSLRRIKRMGVLLKLKSGPRDLDKPIKTADGKEKARKEVPKSTLLEKEIDWLLAYMNAGGKKIQDEADAEMAAASDRDDDDKRKGNGKKKKDPASPPRKKQAKPAAAAPKAKPALARKVNKKRQQLARHFFGDDADPDDCEIGAALADLEAEMDGWDDAAGNGWNEMPRRGGGGGYGGGGWGVKQEAEPFSGVGRRLGN